MFSSAHFSLARCIPLMRDGSSVDVPRIGFNPIRGIDSLEPSRTISTADRVRPYPRHVYTRAIAHDQCRG